MSNTFHGWDSEFRMNFNAVSKIAANAVNGIVTFTHEQNINERIKLMNKFSQIF